MSHDEIREVVADTRRAIETKYWFFEGIAIPIKNTLILLCAAVEQRLSELKERDAGKPEAHDGGPLDAGR